MAGRRAQNAPRRAAAPGSNAAGRARRRALRATSLTLLLGAALLGGCGGSGGGAAHTRRRSPATSAVAPAPRESAAQASLERGRPAHPNVVFVLTDDLAWNLVRYMPHVLRLQREGETFSNYYVTDSLCCPSRASILTGRFPHDTRVFDNSPPEGGYSVFHERGEQRQTFAVALQHVGYRTAMMGKYLNGYEPGESERARPRPGVPPGWNEWDVAGNGYPEYGYEMNSDGRVRSYGYAAHDYLTDVLARKGVRFIDRAAAARRPFLLEIATFAPHAPFTPAPRDAGSFAGLRAPRTPAFNTVGVHEPAWLSSFVPLDARQVSRIDAKFRRRAQAVQAVDRMIGEIERELAAKGLARDTYIVFSSDNGLHMGEHRLEPGKLTAFDTDIRVPLIVAGPGVPAARTVPQMTENIDLCPTLRAARRRAHTAERRRPQPRRAAARPRAGGLAARDPRRASRARARRRRPRPADGRRGQPAELRGDQDGRQPVRRVRDRRTRVLRPAHRPVRARQRRLEPAAGEAAPAAPRAPRNRALSRCARVLARGARADLRS